MEPGAVAVGVPRVAMLLVNIGRLSGGGGAERFCAQVLSRYRRWSERRFDLRLITDPDSLERLRASGYLSGTDDVELLPRGAGWGATLKQIRVLRGLTRDLALVHLPLISSRYLPYLWSRALSWHDGPRLTVQVVDVNLARTYFSAREWQDAEQRRSALLHRLYFATVPLDGMYTWYRAWAACAPRVRARGRPLVHAAACYFVDTERFAPAPDKEKIIVFAGRLIAVKRPLLFVQAIHEVMRRAPRLLHGWRVRMYGGGPMEPDVRRAIERAHLGGLVEVAQQADLAPVLARSKLFVSTHAGENFSSLVLLEAMACGNAVVAQDVGQTRDVIDDRGNGVLTRGDSPEDFAQAICEYLEHPEYHEHYARRSREITLTRHTEVQFFRDLEAFWEQVLARPQ